MKLRSLMQLPFYLACLLISGCAQHDEPDQNAELAYNAEPIQGKATVELKFDKKQYYLGEPCVGEFILKNTDEKDISFNYGGDYRGSNRALRFRVQAIDADGSRPAIRMATIPHQTRPGHRHRQKIQTRRQRVPPHTARPRILKSEPRPSGSDRRYFRIFAQVAPLRSRLGHRGSDGGWLPGEADDTIGI